MSAAVARATGAVVPATPPAAAARDAIARGSKSFALASRLLDTRTRDDTAVVYAWCRHADDAVDLAPDAGSARAALDRLGAELRDALAGGSACPVAAAFARVARARGIPEAYPRALLAGMAMDVAGMRYVTVAELVEYAWCVAGVVGAMMCHVLGVFDDAALVPAAQLGIAMQLTNICRDVAEDAARGRCYVPAQVLARHGGRSPAAMAGAVAELLALADRYYRAADRGIRALPWRAALAVRAARRIYAAIGDQIARTGHDVAAGRAVTSRARKLREVAIAALVTLGSLPRRLASALARRRARPPMRTLELADVTQP